MSKIKEISLIQRGDKNIFGLKKIIVLLVKYKDTRHCKVTNLFVLK